MVEDIIRNSRKRDAKNAKKSLNRESQPIAAKRLKIIAQGFNPGLLVPHECALLVRRSFAIASEGGKVAPERDTFGVSDHLTLTQTIRPNSCAAFRARQIKQLTQG